MVVGGLSLCVLGAAKGRSRMVYGFVIHTVGATLDETPNSSRVLYSKVFNYDMLDQKQNSDEQYLHNERIKRKQRIAIVARQAESMCLLSRQASGRPASDFIVHPTDEPIYLLEEDVGVFSLPPGDVFTSEKIVLWVSVFSLGFSLICDSQENLTLAECTLRTVVKYLVDSLKLLTNSSNVVLKADKIEMSLDKFMPHGQLLFLNHQATQALEKELSNSMPL
ncbi:AP-5 complex subunit sigma-1 isoform X2 [Xenopus tropicalis]|uniref:AP-5 complex subunit sigma-1 isoform X2 n=1 Tax=Xenopus tropicalis TaxID=8364 RepID=F7E666_XENTR|nr:AP-5 complex subunit sigma-1 isoform X2 [Xenopus tropicalis]|eukprot:XP_012821406.1 PREDICTED: AP-5 complex subunit sigma-1 isoform X2 [Xenopus tropicalis]